MGQESISKLSLPDLVNSEIRIKLQLEVMVLDIIEEEALIDMDHVQSLKESMLGERGQISPVTLRARMNEGKIVYDVIDGFHRCSAIRQIQQVTNEPIFVSSIVLFACNDEELYDLRVLAASSVGSIKFARMAEWMSKSFLSTQWKNSRINLLISSEDITLSQVFSLAFTNSSGKILDLNSSEVEELKEWAHKKSQQWRRPLSSLMADMRTVEQAAPDLVQRVRKGGGGTRGKGVLTHARLEAIVRHLPGMWEMQRKLVDLAIQRNILAPDLDFLSFALAYAIDSNDTISQEKILSNPEMYLHPSLPYEEEKGYKHQNLLNNSIDFGRASKSKSNKGHGQEYLEIISRYLFGMVQHPEHRVMITLGGIHLDLQKMQIVKDGSICDLSENQMVFVFLLSILKGRLVHYSILNSVIKENLSHAEWVQIYNSVNMFLSKLSPGDRQFLEQPRTGFFRLDHKC